MFFALLTMLLIKTASCGDYTEVAGDDGGGDGGAGGVGSYHSDMDTDAIAANLAAGKIPTDAELIEIKNIAAAVIKSSSKDTEIMKLMKNVQKAVPWAKINELIPYEEIRELLPVALDDESTAALQAICKLTFPTDEGLIALKNYVIKVAKTAKDAPP